MDTVVKTTGNQRGWTIVSDDNCPVVRFMTRLVRSCDRTQFFQFIGRENTDEQSRLLFCELNSTPWSLLLIDDAGHYIQGPEAIPFILKNLPSGRLACVAYLIPGTMWITRTLYMYVSRNRRKIGKLSVAAQSTDSGKNAA